LAGDDWIDERIVRKFGLSDRFSYIEGDVLKADFGNGYDIAPLGHISHTEGGGAQPQVVEENL